VREKEGGFIHVGVAVHAGLLFITLLSARRISLPLCAFLFLLLAV
jgi:hypothetical protein